MIYLEYADLNNEVCRPCVDFSAGFKECTTCASDGVKVACTVCSGASYFL